MRLVTKLLLLSFGFSLVASQMTGNNPCNGNTCGLLSTNACDAGFCCETGTGTHCVWEPTYDVGPNEACNGNCHKCPNGYFCQYGSGGVTQTGYCKLLSNRFGQGKACTQNYQCESGFCLDGICAWSELDYGATCSDDRQCLSATCATGKCAGSVAAGDCCDSNCQKTKFYCDQSLSCVTPDVNQNAPRFYCQPQVAQGGFCQVTEACAEWLACAPANHSTQFGTCQPFWSGAEGAPCPRDSGDYCQRHLKCLDQNNDPKCTAVAVGTPCADGNRYCHEPFQQCICDPTNPLSTTCQPALSVCQTEFEALVACLKTNNCPPNDLRVPSVTDSGRVPPVGCTISHCQTEYAKLLCCQYCGSGNPMPRDSHIDCSTNTYTPSTCAASTDPLTCVMPGKCTTCPTNSPGTACSGHGTCQTSGQVPICQCSGGWTGEKCDQAVPTPAPCSAGSPCPPPAFACGSSADCNNNGQCVSGDCICYSGCLGVTCASGVCTQTCTSRGDCSNHGDCNNNACVCDAGYSGPLCATANVCSGSGVTAECNYGTCSSGVCTCRPGCSGANCETGSCTAACSDTSQCSFQGSCVSGACACWTGCSGTACQSGTCSAPACFKDTDCNSRGICNNGACSCCAGASGSNCQSGSCTGPIPAGPPPPPSPAPDCYSSLDCGNGRGTCVRGGCVCNAGCSGTRCQIGSCSTAGSCTSSTVTVPCSGKGTCDGTSCTCNVGCSGTYCETGTCTANTYPTYPPPPNPSPTAGPNPGPSPGPGSNGGGNNGGGSGATGSGSCGSAQAYIDAGGSLPCSGEGTCYATSGCLCDNCWSGSDCGTPDYNCLDGLGEQVPSWYLASALTLRTLALLVLIL